MTDFLKLADEAIEEAEKFCSQILPASLGYSEARGWARRCIDLASALRELHKENEKLKKTGLAYGYDGGYRACHREEVEPLKQELERKDEAIAEVLNSRSYRVDPDGTFLIHMSQPLETLLRAALSPTTEEEVS